jgi:hypothetical protein
MHLHQAIRCSYETLSLTDTLYLIQMDNDVPDCDVVWFSLVPTGQSYRSSQIFTSSSFTNISVTT